MDSNKYIWILVFCVIFLLAAGVTMVMSSSWALSYMKNSGDSFYFFKRHITNVVVGIIVLVVCSLMKTKWMEKSAYILFGLSGILLVAVLFIGVGGYAAPVKRWIGIGGVFIQPSEFAKLGLLLFIAKSLADRQGINNLKEFGIPLVATVAVAFLIVLEPDMSMAVLVLGMAAIVLFIAGIPWKHIAWSSVISVPMLIYVAFDAQYRIERLIGYLDPWRYARGKGYQVVQSLIALGSGGFFGKGPGGSFQKLFYLPQPHTDFIFSILGEEFGFIGTSFITVAYLTIILIGLRIGRRAVTPFASYLVIGAISLIALEVIINIGVCTGILPTTGIPLPFISYGGSSMIVSMAIIGITISAAREIGKSKGRNDAMINAGRSPAYDDFGIERRREESQWRPN